MGGIPASTTYVEYGGALPYETSVSEGEGGGRLPGEALLETALPGGTPTPSDAAPSGGGVVGDRSGHLEHE